MPVISDPGRGADARIVYNPGIKRYLLTYSWYQDSGNIALLDAPEPWGPWTEVFYSTSWQGKKTFEYSFPQKRISADGKTMYMVYSWVPSELDVFVVQKVTLTTVPTETVPPAPPTNLLAE